MRWLIACLLAAGCTCGRPFEPLDGGADDGGGQPMDDGGTMNADSGTTAELIVPTDGVETSIALDPQERPQILLRHDTPILASWTGSTWDVLTLFDPDAGTGFRHLVDDLTLSIDRTGVRHMSWKLDVGNIEYATWDGTTLQRLPVFTAAFQSFGAVPVSPRDARAFPMVGWVKEGTDFPTGTHFGRQQPDGGFNDISVECCTTRNVAIAARPDGGAVLAWESFAAPAGMRYAEELPDGGFALETFAELSEGQLSMALGRDGVPQLIFQHNGGVAWATRDGGGWSIEDIEPAPAGEFTSLALAPDDSPRAVFNARDGGLLVHARRTAQGWTVTPIAPEAFWPSIAVDSHGASHVSYVIPEDGGIRYLKVP